MNTNPLQISSNGWQHTYTEAGEWISKVVPFKITQLVKAESPPYKVIEQLEENYAKVLHKHLSSAMSQIIDYLD